MTDDPYLLLGVARDASPADIRKAYRGHAKKHHPDLHPGDAAAVRRFHDLTTARDILADPAQRARYDQGEIDGAGRERFTQPQRGNGWSERQSPSAEDLKAQLNAMFRRQSRQAEATVRRGWDEYYTMVVAFLDAVNGAVRRLELPDGRVLDVKVPAGTVADQVLRLRGEGGPGQNGGPAGDALIAVQVSEHSFFTRDGADIRVVVPVSLAEVVLGGFIEIPTPRGTLRLRVPRHSDNGTALRLRGRGVPAHGGAPAGDLWATLRVVLGTPDAALEAFLRDHVAEPTVNPRQSMLEGG